MRATLRGPYVCLPDGRGYGWMYVYGPHSVASAHLADWVLGPWEGRTPRFAAPTCACLMDVGMDGWVCRGTAPPCPYLLISFVPAIRY